MKQSFIFTGKVDSIRGNSRENLTTPTTTLYDMAAVQSTNFSEKELSRVGVVQAHH